MAASRNPKPLGTNPEVQDLNDGTMVRRLSPRPGPVGWQAPAFGTTGESPYNLLPRSRLSSVGFQVLRQGSRGPGVRKLQRLLNRRLTPSPKLTVDGLFGPSTHQAVVQYQRGISVNANGIVDKQTWYLLIRGDVAAVTQASAHEFSLSANQASSAIGIWEWSLTDKFIEVLRRTGPRLPGSVRHEFEAFLSPGNLAIIAGTFVIWAGSHAFGVGEVVDLLFLISGVIYLGRSILDAAEALGNFLVVTSEAENEEDLDEGASYLSIAITILGVIAFFAILAKVGSRSGRRGGNPKEPLTSEEPPNNSPGRYKGKLSRQQTKVVPVRRKPSFVHGQSDGGPGVWGKPKTPRSSKTTKRSSPYQQKITGAPEGTEYLVPLKNRKTGEVAFDGYDPERNTLLDAKEYNNFPPKNVPRSVRSQMETKILDEAKDQIDAANGTSIEWHIPNPDKAAEVKTIFFKNRVKGITIVNTPY